MEVKNKIRLSHAVIHFYMFISGLEYAVIFPTLWEYLISLGIQPSQTYWLGLVISAMTVTDILTGLVAGRLVDKHHRIRLLVFILNWFQVCGAGLYLISSSPCLLLISRLVSGCGKCIAVIFLADICKSTSREERTPVLLLFNIASQLGLLLGPSLNLVLHNLDITIFNLRLSKLNGPGLLLVGVWTVFSLLVLLAYSDLAALRSQEVLVDHLDHGYYSDTQVQEVHPTKQDEEDFEENLNSADESGLGVEVQITFSPVLENEVFNSVEAQHSDGDDVNGIQYCAPTTNHQSIHFKEKVEGIRYDSRYLQGSSPSRSYSRFQHAQRSRNQSYNPLDGVGPNQLPLGEQDGVSSLSPSYGSMDTVDSSSSSRWEYARNPMNCLRRDTRKSDKFIIEAERIMGQSLISGTESSTLESDMLSLSSSSDTTTTNVSWSEYRSALCRREVLVLILTRFMALFCQTSMEVVVAPVMNTYFRFNDMANSYLYLAAGLELLLMFALLTLLTRYVADHRLVLCGLVLMVAALLWNTVTFPLLHTGKREYVPYFGVSVFLQLMGIPVVCDIGIALYSKLLPDRVQGLGHAVRRFISQFAILLGPLWGGATLSHPLLFTFVPLVLQVLATLLYIGSYKRMKPREENSSPSENTPLLT